MIPTRRPDVSGAAGHPIDRQAHGGGALEVADVVDQYAGSDVAPGCETELPMLTELDGGQSRCLRAAQLRGTLGVTTDA